MRKVKKENDSETQHANFWKPNEVLGFTCGFGCFSSASTTRSYNKKQMLQQREHNSLLQQKTDASAARAQLAPTGKS